VIEMNPLTHRASIWTGIAFVAAGLLLGGLIAGLAQRFTAARRAALLPKPEPEQVDTWKNEGGSTTVARAVAAPEGPSA
jgi:hypothetical protein